MVSIEKQLEYFYNLEYIYIKSTKQYNKLKKYKILLSLLFTFKINNINKLENTLNKLSCWYNYYNLNNLSLNLKYLTCEMVKCNLPPNVIYLKCYCYNDIYNLPRSLQFIYIYIDSNKNIKLPKEFIDNNYNNNKIKFLNIYYYENIIKLKSNY